MNNTLYTPRRFLLQLSCAALGLASSLSAMAKSPVQQHPNVLFIIADDLCTALCGCAIHTAARINF